MNLAALNDPEENELQRFICMINSDHRSVQLEGITGIRKFISMDENPPIQKVVDSRIVPKLLEFMTWELDSQFQVESAWCVVNICSNEQEFTDFILDLGGLDIILNLFDSNVDDLITNAIWAIRNIVLTGIEYRDLCLEKDSIQKILQTLEKFPNSNDIIEDTIEIIADLCKGSPVPNWEKILPTFPVLYKYISEIFSQKSLENALISISCIASDNPQEVIDQACVPFLINHLCEGSSTAILLPTLRALGNILYGDSEQMAAVLNFPEFLPKIFELTASSEDKKVQREAFWTISNIIVESKEYVEIVLQNNELIARLKAAVAQGGMAKTVDGKDLPTLKVAKEAAWIIINLISCGTAQQIHFFVDEYGITESFFHILTKIDDLKQEVLEVILKAVDVRDFDLRKDCMKHIKEAGLVEIIQELANDEEFSSNAELILEYFFPDNSDWSDEED